MNKKIQVGNLEKLNDRIYAICTPYHDIYTTVYFVKTECGTLVFDTARYDRDIEDAVIPALYELGVSETDLKYIFVSHDHSDHAGGLCRLLESYPNACVVTRSKPLEERFSSYTVVLPQDGDVLLDDLRVVYMTGHTSDCMALYDGRTKALISGDCLQLYGVLGSGMWGMHISFFTEYAKNVQKLRGMDIGAIFTSHDYYPYGRIYCGREEITEALDACLDPITFIQQLIDDDPNAADEIICEIYNSQGNLPTLDVNVVKKYRETVSVF